MKEHVVEVESCRDCLFLYDNFACTLKWHLGRNTAEDVEAERKDPIYDHTSAGEGVPSWCPLRETTVTIRLKKEKVIP